MEDQLKQVLRRLESVEKTLNIVHKDRDIFEDISIRLRQLEDTVKYQAERLASLEKRLGADVKEMGENVIEIKDALSNE